MAGYRVGRQPAQTYAQTVLEILARDFLHGEQTVNTLDLLVLTGLPS